jgi:amino acid adenylation domain-containing protein
VSAVQQMVEGFALSSQQLQLWKLMAASDSSYVARCQVLIEGEVDRQVLLSALENIIARHEILRTSFHVFPGLRAPNQVIADPGRLLIAQHDLSAANTSSQDAFVAELYEKLRREPFDLEQAPMLRATLVRLSSRRHILLLGLPGLCADAATMRNLLAALVSAYSASPSDQLADEPLQYADLAEWQNELLEGADTVAGRDFWRLKDYAALGRSRLPRLRGAESDEVLGFEPGIERVEVEVELVRRVAERAAAEGVEEAAYYFGCWQVLLWRLIGESPLICGFYCDGRNYSNLRHAFGPLGRSVPIICQLEPNQSFREVLHAATEQVQEARKWAIYFCLERLTANETATGQTSQRLEQPAAPSITPDYFPLCYEWEMEDDALQAEALRWAMPRVDVVDERFEMKLRVVRKQSSVALELQYDLLLFTREEAALLAQRYLCALRGASKTDNCCSRPLVEVEILGEPERRLVIDDWNQTQASYGEARSLARLFEEQAERTPDGTALVFEDQRLTYRELNHRANQLGHYLSKLGVKADSLVTVHLERSIEMVVGLLGILKAGGAYVPLDPMNPRERLALMLEDVGAGLLLTQRNLVEGLPAHRARVVCLDRDWEESSRGSSDNPAVDVTADNLAYVIYTSGSTGRPKGVMVSHRAIHNRLRWGQEVYPLGETDRVLQGAAFGFDFSVWEIFAALSTGACLVIPRPWAHLDSASLVALIAEQSVTAVHFVPTLFQMFLDEPRVAECRSLKYVFSGGEALPVGLLERFFDHLDAALFNQYGPTEATVDATFWVCHRTDVGQTNIPIGRPIGNTGIYLLDARLQPVPIGVPGELFIAGAGLARGYLNRPDLTAEKFIPHPFGSDSGARLYRTGDLARYRLDGAIEFLGRLDQQVKVRGTRIELGEIEAILRRHPAVKEAALTVRGEGLHEKRLLAYLVLRNGTSPTVGDLHSFVKARLPDNMVPSAFTVLDALPLTPTGKVDRRALPEPDHNRPLLGESLVVPRTVVQEMLAGVWCRVLKLERLGIHDNFFELGGHSLLVIQVISRVREAFAVDLTVRSVFEHATVAELAAVIEIEMKTGSAEPVVPLLPRSSDDKLPLSFAQQRLWFLHQLESQSYTYNIFEALRLTGQLNTAALEKALNEINLRHEVLRTTFHQGAGQLVQVIAAAHAELLSIIDLSHLPADERIEETRRRGTIASQLPFDLEHGPLWRAQLVRLRPQDHVLLTTMHHIVFDAWSAGVFIRELTILYNAFANGRPSPLPELKIQYADFALWQREWLSAEVIERQVSYWKQQLANACPVLAWVTDPIRSALQTQHGARASRNFSPELSSSLAALSRRENVTLFMTLLTVFNILLHHYTRQLDILVGTNSAGRNRSEIEGLIGFFVNMLVIRTKLDGDPTFRELLAQVRETTLGAYTHHDLPFDMLIEELKIARDPNRTALFQVVFTLQNAPVESLRLEGLSLSSIEVKKDTTKFDLVLNMFETPLGLVAATTYNTNIFTQFTMDHLLDAFGLLLEQVAQRPDGRLSDMDEFLSEARRGRRQREEEKFKETRHHILRNLKRRTVSETLAGRS